MDSPLDTSEVEQYSTFNDSIAMVMVVYTAMELMELPT